jgi:lipoprotein-anchoring transpeptidase ErfK/SrfK
VTGFPTRLRSLVLTLAACATAGTAAARSAPAADVPQPVKPAFTVPHPRLLSPRETRAIVAPVLRSVEARRAPSPEAPPVARVRLRTPEGTSNLVLLLGGAKGRTRSWVHVRLPVLPNNSTGWVPRAALGGYRFLRTRLVVDRKRLTATLYYDHRVIFRAPVGVGRPESPTPPGRFYVRDKLTSFPDPFYGPVAFGTSARSPVLTDWPAGGFVGIHGTNQPGLIPGRISHGCIRLRNADILRLARLMPVGTPLIVR